jgi:hypothetical protein
VASRPSRVQPASAVVAAPAMNARLEGIDGGYTAGEIKPGDGIGVRL